MGTILERQRVKGTVYQAKIKMRVDGKVFNVTKTFAKKQDAKRWISAKETEIRSAPFEYAKKSGITLQSIIKHYLELGDSIGGYGRSKTADLIRLSKTELALKRVNEITVQDYLAYIIKRRDDAAGSTVKNDMIWLRNAISTIATVTNQSLNTIDLEKAVKEAYRLRLLNSSQRRDRRPTQHELDLLMNFFSVRNSDIPMVDICNFAIESTRRLAEITRIEWNDLNHDDKTILVRDLKKSTGVSGNHMRMKLFSGAYDLIMAQEKADKFIFPYNPRTISTIFTRSCEMLGIKDLHFHDLRHEGISRLFEKGYQIQEVALVSLHRSLSSMQIYINLKPGELIERSE